MKNWKGKKGSDLFKKNLYVIFKRGYIKKLKKKHVVLSQRKSTIIAIDIYSTAASDTFQGPPRSFLGLLATGEKGRNLATVSL